MNGRYQGIFKNSIENNKFTYTARIKYKDKGKEKRVTKTFKRLSDAYHWRLEMLEKKGRGELSSRYHQPQKATLGFVVEEFLASRSELRSYVDIEWVLKGKMGIVEYFGADFDLSRITDRDIRDFKNYLKTRKKRPVFKTFKSEKKRLEHLTKETDETISDRTKDKYLCYLGALLKKAFKMGLIRYIPEIPMFNNNRKRKLKINLATVLKLMKTLPGPPKSHRAIIVMSVVTGQRWGDVAKMKRSRIHDLFTKNPKIEGVSSKTNTEGIFLPMPEILAEELRRLSEYWKPENSYLFPNPKTKKPYTAIKKAMETACKKQGITPFEFYQFRHLFGTEHLRYGGDANATAKAMGHADTKMIEKVYGHVVDRANPGVVGIGTKLKEIQTAMEAD